MADPSQSELEILQSLWAREEATVREVNEDLNKLRPIGYTSTLKAMQLMTQKSWLGRRLVGKTHFYHALLEEKQTMSSLLNHFVDSTFKGSRKHLLVNLLGQSEISDDEIKEIKELIKNKEGK